MNFIPLIDQPILPYVIALAIGLLIGTERERRKGTGPNRSAMGIRTFATVSLLGAVSLTLGDSMLLAVMALAIAGLATMTVVLETTDQSTLFELWLPLVCAGITATVYGVFFTIIALRQNTSNAVNLGQLFSLKTALLFAMTISVVMLLAAALQQSLGKEGVIVVAAIAGFADTHSATVAVASLVATGKLTAHDAVLPILTSMTTNSITKIILATLSGNIRFISAIIPGLVLVMIAAWLGAAFTLGYFN